MKWLTHLIAGLLLLISGYGVSAELVFIHSYHFEYPWVVEYREGFNRVIADASVHEFEMDTKRRPPSEFAQVTEQAWQFIQAKQADVVVLADDNALKHVGPKLVEHRIPFVFLGINANPRQYIAMTEFSSGVLERPLLKRSAVLVTKVMPKVKKVLVMMDKSVTSDAIIDSSFDSQLRQSLSGVEVDIVGAQDYSHWQQLVERAPEQEFDAIIVGVYARLKEHGRHVPIDEVTRWTSANSELPVFAFWSYSVGKDKAIGGLLISALEQGETAASHVNTFLRTGKMPAIATPKRGAFVFSQAELARWGIVLPADIKQKAQIKN
ncbi:hypothetical protein EXU30_14745 [Shewanella maritima]|uniref:Sugar ABC transporter substrate-binding protein n=1 Tax=Shewanella maritima TaxID=2520507 RepID=A0A411PJY6_9GAMM|nr:hypothetical protein [Shewanella maritima]QBF83804.1 hypothetical protein EXU30_14745 [Shewanella maritima]